MGNETLMMFGFMQSLVPSEFHINVCGFPKKSKPFQKMSHLFLRILSLLGLFENHSQIIKFSYRSLGILLGGKTGLYPCLLKILSRQFQGTRCFGTSFLNQFCIPMKVFSKGGDHRFEFSRPFARFHLF